MSEGDRDLKPENPPQDVPAPLVWARTQRDPAQAAQARMGALPQGMHPGSLETPFDKVPKDSFRASIKGAGVAKLAAAAPIGSVRLRDLVTPQRSINQERLSQHLADPDLVPKGSRSIGSGMPKDLPVVVKVGGKHVIFDGNHRLTAAKLRGETRAKARIVDLDGDGS